MSVRNRAKACEFNFFARVRIQRANGAKPCEMERNRAAKDHRNRASEPGYSFLLENYPVNDGGSLGFFRTNKVFGSSSSRVYSSAIAETKATKIGVLEPKADDRRCNSGIFSSIAWHSFSGGPCGRVVRLAGSFGRYANPARSAHPDWRRDERNHKPFQRSIAMSEQSIHHIHEAAFRVRCASDLLAVISSALTSPSAQPCEEVFSNSIFAVSLLLDGAHVQLSEVAK